MGILPYVLDPVPLPPSHPQLWAVFLSWNDTYHALQHAKKIASSDGYVHYDHYLSAVFYSSEAALPQAKSMWSYKHLALYQRLVEQLTEEIKQKKVHQMLRWVPRPDPALDILKTLTRRSWNKPLRAFDFESHELRVHAHLNQQGANNGPRN